MSVAGSAPSSARLEALRGPQLRKRLYVVFWINDPGSTREQHLEVLPTHLKFLLDLERRGVLFASGPFSMPDGLKASFNGMTILRAENYEAARDIVEREPFVTKGLRTYVMHAWDLNEGAFSVRLSFGTGTFEVP